MFKLGCIGGSIQSAVGRTHIIASQMDKRFKVVSGCFSTKPFLNLDSAKEYGVSKNRVYDTWEKFLVEENESLDAVIILTPTPQHFEMVKVCLENNIPVICEKSLAVSSKEVEELQKIEQDKKGFLAVTYNYSGYPMVRELRYLIESGKLGEVRHFQIEMPQEGFIRTDTEGNKPCPQAWRLKDNHVPTIHLDLGSHLHHLIYYLIKQNPISVIADQGSCGWFPEVYDNVMCMCRYTNSVMGQMWFSKSALGHRNGLKIRIYGSEASAEWFQVNPEELLLSYNNGRREIIDRASGVTIANQGRYNRFKSGHPAGFIEAFANLYSDIAGCLNQHKQCNTWVSDEVFGTSLALEGIKMLEAMNKSFNKYRWEQL